MKTSTANFSERANISTMTALEPYKKELEFIIAQVWMTNERRSQTLNDAIVIDAHLEEAEGVIWRVDDKRSSSCLAAALRSYSVIAAPKLC